MSEIHQNRRFMHCPSFKGVMAESDQSKGIKNPPFSNTITGELITLPPFDNALKHSDYAHLLDIRRSVRSYATTPMTQAELAFLLYSAQGIQAFRAGGVATLRPAPSGGARHPFETYIAVNSVEGLAPGLYRYAPLENVLEEKGKKRAAIERLGPFTDYEERITKMLAGKGWAGKAPIVLFFTCVAYRGEWRYVTASHRVMLIDLGHVGQNVMLSAAALGLGSCCLAAYDQEECDKQLNLDGLEEYTVYGISVGTPKEEAE